MRSSSFVLGLLLVAPAWADGSFLDLDFDAASAQAKAEGKLLLVDFTATWCPPCRMMEKQTWPDEKVQSWVREHAVAIQVDIDQHWDLALRFGFEGIPTVVLLKDGSELDRHTGYWGPDEFLEWGDGVASGKNTAATRAAVSAADAASDDPHRRYDAAKELAAKGHLDEALEQFLWVWKSTRGIPSWIGLRQAFLLSDMTRLAERHAPAKAALNGLLEDSQSYLETGTTISLMDWMEWVALCRELGQRGRVSAWYDAHRADDGTLLVANMAEPVATRARSNVFDQLVADKRYLDAARAGGDLLARARQSVEIRAKSKQELQVRGQEEILKAYDATVLKTIASLYGCSFAAGWPDQAHEIADLVVQGFESGAARLELARAALGMSETRDAQVGTLLDEAERLGAPDPALRAQWEQRTAPAATAPAGG